MAVTAMDRWRFRQTAFSVLAGYIFGSNADEQKIAMTAPVQQTMDGSEKEMAFMMPAEYALELTLPDPDDERVAFREAPAYTAAVIQLQRLGDVR